LEQEKIRYCLVSISTDLEITEHICEITAFAGIGTSVIKAWNPFNVSKPTVAKAILASLSEMRSAQPRRGDLITH
jgi:hypothetical protein